MLQVSRLQCHYVNARSATEFLSWLIDNDLRFFPVPDLLQLLVETIPFVAILLKRLWELHNNVKHEGEPVSPTRIEDLLRVEMGLDAKRYRAATELTNRLTSLGLAYNRPKLDYLGPNQSHWTRTISLKLISIHRERGKKLQ